MNTDETLSPLLAGLHIPGKAAFKEVFRDLANSVAVSDERFDGIYPEPIRLASATHWTPVAIARRAIELLTTEGSTRILDIGSGAGKFCLVAGASSKAHITGVEQRPHLVWLSRELARRYNVKRVTFLHSKMEEIDWRRFDGFYFFNPFVENLYADDRRIDEYVDFCQERYVEQVRTAQKKLADLPVGTRIVTYHGFGGDLPPDYLPIIEEKWGGDSLVLWERIV